MRVCVIGAGIGGLATAIRLAVKGYDVTVYEKNSYAGGKISELRMEDYRFDTGPSLFTMPELTKELFDLCGESIENYLPYKRLSNNCKYFFSDGSVFNFYHDKKRLSQELQEKSPDSLEPISKRLERSREVYELSAPVFLFSSFGKLSNFNTPPYKKVAKQLYKLDFFRTMNQANSKDFKDRRLVQLFNRYATYNGSNPYKAPATLNMIAHLENNIGAFFPDKGIYAIADSLYKLAVKQGVNFIFNTRVDSIEVIDKVAKGIYVNGTLESYDLVISDVDCRYLANKLMLKHPLKGRLNRSQPSSSALIFYWSINREFKELDLHNIFFSADYKEEFKKIFTDKTIIDDPTVYLFISSKVVEGDAPKGCENWFVMVNSPVNAGQNWDELRANTRKQIIEKINRTLGVSIEEHIVSENIVDPVTIETNTMSMDGALYGMSSNSMFSAFLRHPNKLSGIKNLYFVGGSVHPGGGIPLCMASAKIVDNEIPVAHG